MNIFSVTYKYHNPEPEKTKRKKTRSAKQKYGDTLRAEKINMTISDMTDHVIVNMRTGYYTLAEFLADPSVYMDSAIMGRYIHNPIVKNAVIKNIKNIYE